MSNVGSSVYIQHGVTPPLTDTESIELPLAYSDSRYADYWKRLAWMCDGDLRQYSESFESSMTTEEWNQFSQGILKEYGTGDKLMSQAREQLVKVTGKAVPIPGTVLMKHWSECGMAFLDHGI
jgi:hypothetical protein